MGEKDPDRRARVGKQTEIAAKSLRKPSQAQKHTGGNVRNIYGVLYAVALVERISAFGAEFRRMCRIGGLPAALVAAVDRRACRALRAAL